MNKPTTSTDIETMIKKLPKDKSLEPDGFTGEFYLTFIEELTHWKKALILGKTEGRGRRG